MDFCLKVNVWIDFRGKEKRSSSIEREEYARNLDAALFLLRQQHQLCIISATSEAAEQFIILVIKIPSM